MTNAGPASRRRGPVCLSRSRDYIGLTIGWVEGFELNSFGAVLGFDIRRPALKLPGIGRFGVAAGL